MSEETLAAPPSCQRLDAELDDAANKLSDVWIALDMVARGQATMTAWEAEKILRHQQAPGWRDSKVRPQLMETQQTVAMWADETFGPVTSHARIAARANEEMAELLRALTADDHHPKAAEEIADIVIVLYRLATRLGVDLRTLVNEKMAKNRTREWKRDGSGHGYHVRDKS